MSGALHAWCRRLLVQQYVLPAYPEHCTPACCQRQTHPASLRYCRLCHWFSHAPPQPHWEHSPSSAPAPVLLKWTDLCNACLRHNAGGMQQSKCFQCPMQCFMQHQECSTYVYLQSIVHWATLSCMQYLMNSIVAISKYILSIEQ